MSFDTAACRIAVLGAGRLGHALTDALRAAGADVAGPLGRDAHVSGADVVFLCVPDGAIAGAAAALAPGPLVGHCSGALGLDVLAPHARRFALHPLMTLTEGARLQGAPAAVDGSDEEARDTAAALARLAGLAPFALDAEDRAAYHAAASIASNFLVTLEAAAERLAASAGVRREQLVPLVRATVENWAALGGERALTGPIARGDEATVARQRAAVAERAPELLTLFDGMCAQTRALAGSAVAA
jgi:predicted short-subunit dehydrogenase-like oxidoreductase (DUF2520 family)